MKKLTSSFPISHNRFVSPAAARPAALAVLAGIFLGWPILARATGATDPSARAGAGWRPPVKIVFTIDLNSNRVPVLNWLKQGDWCWAVAGNPEISDESLLELKRSGLKPVVTALAHPESRKRQWAGEWRLPVPDIPQVIARYQKFFGTNFVWELMTEDDSSGVGFSQTLLREKPRTHAVAKQLFDAYLGQVNTVMQPHAAVRRWARVGFAPTAHRVAALGVECVLVERTNDDVEDLPTAITFARGAARQSGCEWGIDFSLWWGVIYGCVQDLPASYHKRNFYVSYFSGADALAVEGGDLLVRLPEVKVSPLGQALDEFGRFTRRVNRGQPEVPVALILPEDHGWMTPPYWRASNEAWNYARVPYRPGDRSLDGFFLTAFPGASFAMDPFPLGNFTSDAPPPSPFALSGVTAQYAPLPENVSRAPSPIPFGRFENRNQARQHFEDKHVDPSPYRPMADSRWGDIFDVFTPSVATNILDQYPVAILLGPVQLDAGLRERLSGYVRAGGMLICPAGVLGPGDGEWCGLDVAAELQVGRGWAWRDESSVHEPFRYLPARVRADNLVEVLARTSGNVPVIARRPLGRGFIYSCLLPWYESERGPLSGLALRMFDEVFGSVQPVKIDGAPVEWLSTSSALERTVVVANHDGQPWSGTIRVQRMDSRLTQCRELLTDRLVSFRRDGAAAELAAQIPSYEVRAFRWRRND